MFDNVKLWDRKYLKTTIMGFADLFSRKDQINTLNIKHQVNFKIFKGDNQIDIDNLGNLKIRLDFEKKNLDILEENIKLDFYQECNGWQITTVDNCSIVIGDNSDITVGNDCKVEAKESSIVKAGNKCGITLTNNGLIQAGNYCTINCLDKNKIFAGDNCKITTSDENEIVLGSEFNITSGLKNIYTLGKKGTILIYKESKSPSDFGKFKNIDRSNFVFAKYYNNIKNREEILNINSKLNGAPVKYLKDHYPVSLIYNLKSNLTAEDKWTLEEYEREE